MIPNRIRVVAERILRNLNPLVHLFGGGVRPVGPTSAPGGSSSNHWKSGNSYPSIP